MPEEPLPMFLRRLQNVAERIRAAAQRAVNDPAGSALKLIAEDAAYLAGEIEDRQSPESARWKCQACGKIAVRAKPCGGKRCRRAAAGS